MTHEVDAGAEPDDAPDRGPDDSVEELVAEYQDDLRSSRWYEGSLVWRELAAAAIVVAILLAHQLWHV